MFRNIGAESPDASETPQKMQYLQNGESLKSCAQCSVVTVAVAVCRTEVKGVKFTLEQATKAQTGSRDIALPSL